MKIRLCVHRKEGRPSYGSDGVGLELELELDSSLLNSPGAFGDCIRLHFGMLEREVADELDRLRSASEPEPAPEPARTAQNGAGRALTPRDGQPVNRPAERVPRSGKQLWAMCADDGRLDELTALADHFGYDRWVANWDGDMIGKVWDALMAPEPAPPPPPAPKQQPRRNGRR
jgi:hypothetical protein